MCIVFPAECTALLGFRPEVNPQRRHQYVSIACPTTGTESWHIVTRWPSAGLMLTTRGSTMMQPQVRRPRPPALIGHLPHALLSTCFIAQYGPLASISLAHFVRRPRPPPPPPPECRTPPSSIPFEMTQRSSQHLYWDFARKKSPQTRHETLSRRRVPGKYRAPNRGVGRNYIAD